ncbi:uncharacterized protein EURHEDRAFT_514482 [Aspergillus ruber CBS 135680]|uniref:Uncharacterized protein n=1 Tax=Aspergillus ruber (strain CBS 135680) TaxID=1388766 RepID=A0A017SJ38_ASPRC|nr:uncharacterized protein EURHEDRAFT_514482 [Aspergillus ruber CBS 135680]EYE96664.1 hypothetical protein EURHEDRAFT_514482 [Aspergillus ruber CBS 135680]
MTAENSIISTTFQLGSNGAWFENLAVRPKGNLLATRIDVPKLWSISTAPISETGHPFYTFPRESSVMGIAEIGEDIYAVVTGNLSISTISPVPGTQPTQNKNLAYNPDAHLLNGIIKFGNNLCLITDSKKGVIWRLDLTTGEYSQALSHAPLLPEEDQPVQVGANGIKALHSYVYFTSTTREISRRIPVDEHASATVQLVAGNEFKLTVAGSTAIALSKDRTVLYVATSGAQIAPVMSQTVKPAKIVAVRL